MWLRHWNLDRDPFSATGGPFVPIPGHIEALARIVHAIEAGWRSAALVAPAGLGKSRILAEALAEVRRPSIRIARAGAMPDGPSLLADLAGRLGRPVPLDAGRTLAWRTLAEAVRLCHWQGLGVVLAIDNAHHLVDPMDRLDLERLAHLASHPGAPLTVLKVGRPMPDEPDPATPWDVAIRLPALSRSESSRYLSTKLLLAGRDTPLFAPRALTKIHALSAGVPAGIDRLATLALMAAAPMGLAAVTPEIVEAVARECPAIGLEVA